MTRNNENLLTDSENDKLSSLVNEAEEMTLSNARLLAQQQQRREREPFGSSRVS